MGEFTGTTGADGGRVMDLLDRQLGLYGRIEQLAEAQGKLIELEDTGPLLTLLTQRQKLSTALTELNAELAPYRARWAEVIGALTPGDRRALNDKVTTAGARLRRILERDEADGRRLAARKSRTAQSMTQLETARRTLVAYGETAGSASGGSPILESTEA